MEGCGNKKYDDYNSNKNDSSLDTTKRVEETFLDIISPIIMEEFENRKKIDYNDSEIAVGVNTMNEGK